MKKFYLSFAMLSLAQMGRAAVPPLETVAKELANRIAQQKQIQVAVAGFSYPDGRSGDGSSYVSEMMTTYLAKDKRFHTVEREQIVQLLSELHLSQTGLLDPKAVKQVGEVLRAEVLVTGTLVDLSAAKTELNARAVFSGTGRIIATTNVLIDRAWASRPRLDSLGPDETSANSLEAIKILSKKLCRDIKKTKTPSLAVLNFPYGLGRMSTGSFLIAERLVTYLSQAGVPIVERRLVENILKEKRMWDTGLVDPKSIQFMGHLLGVDAVVIGTLADFPDKNVTEVVARVVQLETGEVLAAATTLVERVWHDLPRLPMMAQPRSPVPGPYVENGMGPTVRMTGEWVTKPPPPENPDRRPRTPYSPPEDRGTHLSIDGRIKKSDEPPPARRLPYRPVAVPVFASSISLSPKGGLSK